MPPPEKQPVNWQLHKGHAPHQRCPTHGMYPVAAPECPLCADPTAITRVNVPIAPGLAPCCQLRIKQAEVKWPGRITGAKPGFHARCEDCDRGITLGANGVWRRSDPDEHRYPVTAPQRRGKR